MTRTRVIKGVRLAGRPALWPALRHGVLPSLEHSDVPLNACCRTVVDVGASRGQFALFAADRFPKAQIICFEPLAEAAAKLEATAPPGRVVVHSLALGREYGKATMHVATDDDSSSLLPIGEKQAYEFGTREESQRRVPITRLEDYLSPALPGPVLLKIDVQGSELDVLLGAGEKLSLVDEILTECSFVALYEGQVLADAVVCYLRERGFILAGVFGVTRAADGDCLQGDLLFRRKD